MSPRTVLFSVLLSFISGASLSKISHFLTALSVDCPPAIPGIRPGGLIIDYSFLTKSGEIKYSLRCRNNLSLFIILVLLTTSSRWVQPPPVGADALRERGWEVVYRMRNMCGCMCIYIPGPCQWGSGREGAWPDAGPGIDFFLPAPILTPVTFSNVNSRLTWRGLSVCRPNLTGLCRYGDHRSASHFPGQAPIECL